MTQFIAAAIQLNVQDDLAYNMGEIVKYVREAADKGAIFITLPENAFFMQAPGKGAHPDPKEAILQCKELARELKIWLLIGSVQILTPEGKSWNRSLLIDDSGQLQAEYDKIHLFDVTLKNGETYSESERIAGGNNAVLAHTPWGKLGMTICYDVRFPHLYRELAHQGADFLAVPAAFTYTTGIAHWHTLLRARAIENGCYVIAPAQCGMHPGNRRTYGHALIINPWGEIVAEASEDKAEIITAVIDTDKIAEARGMIPSLRHDKSFTVWRADDDRLPNE
jgi:predicted amidohydrolase